MIIENPILLLADDSQTDVLLMRTVFERAGFVLPLQAAHDGLEAIAYLKGDGAYGDRIKFPLPTVMLLDLNMPKKDGFEVLTWIRQQPALKRLRVYVLSASSRSDDIRRAYDLGANSYLVKPSNLDALMQLAKILVGWLKRSHFAPLEEIGQSQVSELEPTSTSRPGHWPSSSVSSAPYEPGKERRSARELAWNHVCLLNEQLEQRLKLQNAELVALRIDREAHTKKISQDIRTPLVIIGGYADLVAQSLGRQLDDTNRQYLQKITETIGLLTQRLEPVAEIRKTVPSLLSINETAVHENSAA